MKLHHRPGNASAPQAARPRNTPHPTGRQELERGDPGADKHGDAPLHARRCTTAPAFADGLSPLRASGNALGRRNQPCASMIAMLYGHHRFLLANSGKRPVQLDKLPAEPASVGPRAASRSPRGRREFFCPKIRLHLNRLPTRTVLPGDGPPLRFGRWPAPLMFLRVGRNHPAIDTGRQEHSACLWVSFVGRRNQRHGHTSWELEIAFRMRGPGPKPQAFVRSP